MVKSILDNCTYMNYKDIAKVWSFCTVDQHLVLKIDEKVVAQACYGFDENLIALLNYQS